MTEGETMWLRTIENEFGKEKESGDQKLLP